MQKIENNTKVGIIGCGLIGKKRAAAFAEIAEVIACFDIDINLKNEFSREFDCEPSVEILSLLGNEQIDAVVISTRHDSLVEIALLALQHNKHVLIEKPGARNLNELLKLVHFKSQKIIHIGYNHIYHRNLQKLLSVVEEETLGELMFVKAKYGHGGRLGYESEWRANKEISGGGELIDQGSHLIHIALKLLGPSSLDYSYLRTFFWDMPVEDNAFLSLRSRDNKYAFLHASCTEWKNIFELEVFFKNGKVVVQGLGRSYGVETLKIYKMLPEMGPPEVISWEYPFEDNSWKIENEKFIRAIEENDFSSSNLDESMQVLKIIGEAYDRGLA